MKQLLRDYQRAALESVKAAWQARKKALVAMATGGGKTTVIAELCDQIVRAAAGRILVVAHTKEIIEQLHARISAQIGQPVVEIEMADSRAGSAAKVVVASRQSLSAKRLAWLLADGVFSFLIVDEAHHVCAGNSYYTIYQTLINALADPSALRVVGFTATPKRSDRKALAAIFDEIVYEWTILDGIAQGHLVPPVRKICQTSISLDQVKTRQGDFELEALSAILDAANWSDLALKAWSEYAENRATLAFFPSVALSKAFVVAAQKAGLAAAHIDATTPKETRAATLEAFKQGAIKIVSNMAVLVEGFDAPAAACVLWARPTQSEVVLTQALGRGLRPAEGKKDCLVLDLTTTSPKALTVGTLLGKMVVCQNCHVQFYRGFVACPHCNTAVPASQKEIRRGGLSLLSHPRDDTGKVLIVSEGSFFEDSAFVWTDIRDLIESAPPALPIWSCSIDVDRTLVIAAPLDYMSSLSALLAKPIPPSALQAAEMHFRLHQVVTAYSAWEINTRTQHVVFLKISQNFQSLANTLIALSDFAKRRAALDATRNAAWRKLAPSPAQRKFAANSLALLSPNAKHKLPESATRGEYSDLITALLAHAIFRHYVSQGIELIRKAQEEIK